MGTDAGLKQLRSVVQLDPAKQRAGPAFFTGKERPARGLGALVLSQ